jgi:hypothetical protein
MTTITSSRGVRSIDLHRASGRTSVASFSRFRLARTKRAARWVSLIYVAVALATPLLIYAGPDVMSPAATVIAGKALDGDIPIHLRSHPLD